MSASDGLRTSQRPWPSSSRSPSNSAMARRSQGTARLANDEFGREPSRLIRPMLIESARNKKPAGFLRILADGRPRGPAIQKGPDRARRGQVAARDDAIECDAPSQQARDSYLRRF